MTDTKAGDTVEFELGDERPGTSGEMLDAAAANLLRLEEPAEDPIASEGDDVSPVFRELALPKLPGLRPENRARLQMQSPNRLHFYWSVRTNPFRTLNKALGAATGDYTLVLRLVDLGRDTEVLQPIEAEGNSWFSVDADSRYRAEIGFWSPSRPFVRVMFSNTVETPRKSPSPRVATEADWRVPSARFAEVLNASGFRKDAFDVAIAGDDPAGAESASQRAFARMADRPAAEFSGFDPEELRSVMLSLAAGAALEDLRFRIGARLFAVLQKLIDSVDRAKALAALRSEFRIDEEELLAEEEEFGPAVFGASRVGFPRRTRLRTRPRGFAPISSHDVL